MKWQFARLINLMVMVVLVLTSCQPPAVMPTAPLPAAKTASATKIQVVPEQTKVERVGAPTAPPPLANGQPNKDVIYLGALTGPSANVDPELRKMAQKVLKLSPTEQQGLNQQSDEKRQRDLASGALAKPFQIKAMAGCSTTCGAASGGCGSATITSPAGATYDCGAWPGWVYVSMDGYDNESIGRLYLSLSDSGGTVLGDQTWCATTWCQPGTYSIGFWCAIPGNGTYTVYAYEEDNASLNGMYCPKSATLTFTTTNCNPPTPPTITAWSPSGAAYNCSTSGGVLNWWFNASDINGNLDYMYAFCGSAATGGFNAVSFANTGSHTHSGSMTFTNDGTYSIFFYASDSGGLGANQSVTFTVSNCATAPKITAWAPGAAYNCGPTGGVMNWSFTATDNQSNLTSMTASISPSGGVAGTPNTVAFGATSSHTHSGTFSLTSDGTYTITFTATDATGYTDTKTQVVTTSNCKAAPTITAWSPNTAAISCTAGYLPWSFTATDNQSNLTSMEIYIKDSTNTLVYSPGPTAFGATGSRTLSGSALLPFDGTFTVTFKATDSTGLTDIKTQSITTTGCDPKPYFTATVPGNGAVSCAGSGGKLSVTLTANDYQADLVSTRIQVMNGGTIYDVTVPFSARGSYTQTALVQLPYDGSFTVWFTATDSGGHSEVTSSAITTTGCDPRPYFISWVPGATYDCNGGAINWSVQVGDYQSDLTQITATLASGLESGTNPNTITFAATGNKTHTGSFYVVDDGTFTITFTATDAAGYSRTMTQTFSTTRCTPKPVITAFAPNTPTYTCVNGRLFWSATAVDYQNDMNKIVVDIKDFWNASIPGMPVTRTFANTGNRTETGSIILPAEGTYTLSINAYDATGHVANAQSNTFSTATCDPTPRILAYSPNVTAVNCGAAPDYWLPWSVSVGDYQGDLSQVTITVTDNYNQVYTLTQPFSGTGDYNHTITGRVQIATNGPTTIVFTAKDIYNNTRSVAQTFTASNCTDPVPTPQIATRAGSMSNTAGSTDGSTTSALFFEPQGMISDLNGYVFAADMMNDRVRLINPTGTVSTYAGTVKGDVDGTGAGAQMRAPNGVALDDANTYATGDDTVYVADSGNNKIKKIVRSTGSVTTFAGPPTGTTTSGFVDGALSTARFTSPKDVTVYRNATGTVKYLYVADTFNNAIRKINLNAPSVTTISTALNRPWGIDCDNAGNVWVAEPAAGRVTKLSPTGTILAQYGSLGQPWDVCVDLFDNVFYSEGSSNTVKRISSGTVVDVSSTTSGPGGTDGPIGSAQLSGPRGLTISRGQLFVSEDTNNRIRQMSTGSYVWGAGTGPQPPEILTVI